MFYNFYIILKRFVSIYKYFLFYVINLIDHLLFLILYYWHNVWNILKKIRYFLKTIFQF